ncbi:YtpI family protein [Salipaludibacillus sp. CUR1]|uniref:YtpI family protein n=1 Tax=Salipaludibacillus sp. CUR1 TaxID=2820003 RepID=UPI001E3F75AD|nr:YtpI family protein [Salipaludibacillus sp. CUR1]MCE7793356.1 YtpI family protein [Salipaludibacillus sp. CUR1]
MFFIFLIFASLVAFVHFKVQQGRATGPVEKRSNSSKGSIAIGIFFISFGINSYMNLQSSVSAFITLIFVIFGTINVFFGLKHYRMLKPHLSKEKAALQNN